MNIYDRRDIGATGLEVVCTDFVPLIRPKREGFWTDCINGFQRLYQRKCQDYDAEQWEEIRQTRKLVQDTMGKPIRKKVRHGTR